MVKENGIENIFLIPTIRPTDYENRSDVIRPLNPPISMVGRFRPEEIPGAGSEGPDLQRSQPLLEQPLDHNVSPGVAAVPRKMKRQVLGRRESREDRQGSVPLDGIRRSRDRHTVAPDPQT